LFENFANMCLRILPHSAMQLQKKIGKKWKMKLMSRCISAEISGNRPKFPILQFQKRPCRFWACPVSDTAVMGFLFSKFRCDDSRLALNFRHSSYCIYG
jgi:hypothetical protein